MKLTTIVKLAAALTVCGASVPASADFVIMEPDDFASGTDISLAWADSGISLHSYSYSGSPGRTLTIGGVQALDSWRAVTGVRDFGTYSELRESITCMTQSVLCPPQGGGSDSYYVLRIDFERPVDFVQVFGGYYSDPIGIYALNSANQIVAQCYGYYSANCFSVLAAPDLTYASASVLRPIRDITSVVIGGISGVTGVDSIRVNVPEPGTLPLLGLCLLLALGASRAQRTRIPRP